MILKTTVTEIMTVTPSPHVLLCVSAYSDTFCYITQN